MAIRRNQGSDKTGNNSFSTEISAASPAEKDRRLKEKNDSPLLSPLALAALGLAGVATASVPAQRAETKAAPQAGANGNDPAPQGAAGQASADAFAAQMAALIQTMEAEAAPQASADQAPTDSEIAADADGATAPLATQDAAIDAALEGSTAAPEGAPTVLAAAGEMIGTTATDAPMMLADASTAAGGGPAGAGGSAASGTAAAGAEAGTAATGTAAGTTAAATTATAAAATGLSMGAALAIGGGIALAGAGGGGGGSAVAAALGTAVTGVVSDGLISGAKVYADMNDNGRYDEGVDQLIGTTNADGTFSGTLSDAQKAHSLIAVGGTDISTGLTFKGAFTAPAGSTVITPLTTLVQAIAQQGGTVAEAKAHVAQALGLPTTIDLTTFNAVAGMVSADNSTATQAQAIEVQAKALMVANIIATGTAALDGATTAAGGTSSASVTQGLSTNIVTGLANAIKAASNADTSVNLSDATTLQQVMTTAVTTAKETVALDDTIANNALSATANAVAAANEIINTAAGSAAQSAQSQASATDASIVEALTQMLQAQTVVQGTVADQLDNGTSTDTTNVTNNFATLANLLGAANGINTTTNPDLKLNNTLAADTQRAVDGTAPTVSSVTGSATTTPFNAGDLIEFKVNMSEGVLISGATPQLDITVDGNARVATFDPGRSSGASLAFVYRVGTADTGAVAVTGFNVNGATITDLANNPAAMALNSVGSGWTVDNAAPTVAVTSAASFLSSGSSTVVTFTLSEAAASSTFTAADITVSGGTLGTLTQSLSDAKVYTASLTPTSGSTAPATVKVNGGVFTDVAGNGNAASNLLAVAVDTVAPQVLVKSNLSSLNAGQTAALTFELSKDATDFVVGDVTVTGGTLSNFAGSGKVYTATFTPTADGTATVKVDADKLTASGNNNTASNTLSLAVDATAPTIAITSNDTVLKAGETATITFDLAEEAATGTFTKEDITVAGGTLGALTQSTTDKTIYTATFTPTADSTAAGSVTVAAAKFTDAAGNANTQGTVSMTVDTVRPKVSTVTDDVGGKANAATGNIAYTYTFSESVSDLADGDFTVTNGSVSSISGNGTTWTVNVTPAANVASGNVILTLKPGAVLDAAGNNSIASTSGNQTLDTLAPSVGTVTDDVSGTANMATASVTYTYTFNEAVSGLVTGDFVATNGTVSAVAAVNATNGASATWTVTVTPTAGVASGNIGLTLNAAAVTDAVGNANAQSSSSAQALDTLAPSVASVTDNVSGTVNAATTSIAYTYTFSEAVTGLAVGDFAATNGTVASVSGSGTTWTVNVTPAAGVASGNISLALNAAAVTDAVGNANASSTSAAQAIDNLAPTVSTYSPADGGDSLGLAANLTLTFAEAMAKGTSGNIVIYKGDGTVVETIAVTDSKIGINGNVVSINPTADLVKDQAYYVQIASGALLDSAGNAYAGITNATTWNFIGAGATVTIDAVAGNDTVNASEAGSAIAVSGTLVAEAAVLADFVAGDFTSAVLTPTSGSPVTLTNLVYNPTTHGWTAQIASGALSGTADYTLTVNFAGTQGIATGVLGTGTKTVHVDTVVATPTLVLATDSGSSNSDLLTNVGTVNVTGIESGATWQYSTDGGTNWNNGSGTSLTVTGADGAKTVVVKQTDAAGNTSANSSSLAFTLDTTAPTTTLGSVAFSADTGTAGDFNTYTAAQTLTATLSAPLAGGEILYGSMDNGATWTNLNSFVSGTVLTLTGITLTGSNTMKLKVQDAAGNDGTVASQAYVLDTTAPTTTISGVAFSADTGTAGDFITKTAAQTITATLSAALGAGEKLLGSLDNGVTWGDVSNLVSGTAVNLTGATLVGSSTMKLKVQDTAGNDGAVASQAYVLDTTAPTIDAFATAKADGNYKAGETIQITATASETVAVGTSIVATLSSGATVTLTAASAGTTLTGTYTVGAGENAADLTVSSFTVGSVVDVAANALTSTTLPTGANNLAAGHAIVVDTTAPSAPTLSPADGGNSLGLAANLTLTFAEAMAKGTSGNIVIYKGDGTVVETIVVTDSKIGINGNVVSINPTADLVKDQAYYVQIASGALVDSAGNAYAGISDTTTWNFIGAGATVTIDAVAGNDTVNASEAGSAISVSGTLVAETAVLADFQAGDFTSAVLTPTSGSPVTLTNLVYNPTTHGWTAQIASGALSGTADYTLTVNFTGSQGIAAGVLGTGTKTVHVDTVVATPTLTLATDSGSSNSDALTNDGTVNVTGIESGATWQYTTDGGGNWNTGTGTSIPLTGNGAKTVAVKQTDAAGNLSSTSSTLSFTVDATAPAKPAITAVTDDTGYLTTDRITSDSTPIFTVTAETGAAIRIGQNGTPINSSLYTAVETGTPGTYTVTVTGALADGGYGMVAVDAAGNVSATPSAGESATFKIDTTASTVTIGNVAFSADTGTAGDFITKTAAQTITATLSAAPASDEVLMGSLDNGTSWQDLSSFLTGTALSWTGVTLVGNSTMKLKVQDAAGNNGAIASQAFTLDTALPSAPTLALAVDSGAVDGITNVGVVNVSGVEANATWQYSTDGGINWINGTGTSLTLSGDGAKSVLARQTDLAGNVGSNSSALALTLDTAAPVAVTPAFDAQGNIVFTGKEATASIQASSDGSTGWAAFSTDTDIPNNVEFTRYFRQVDSATNAGPASATAYTFYEGTANADSQNFSARTNPIFSMLDNGNDVLVAGSGNDFLGGGGGADTITGGGGADSIDLGAADSAVDILKLLAASDSTQGAPDRIGNFASGDKVDLSAVLSGYTSSVLADTGSGFIELKNLVLLQNTPTGKTTVTFDVTFDAATYQSAKVSGAVLDLAYDYTTVTNSQVTNPTFSYTDDFGTQSASVWKAIEANLKTVSGTTANGRIAMIAEPDQGAVVNPIIDANGKVLTVSLVVNALVSTFSVALESGTGKSEISTSGGTYAVDVGIAKIAGAAAGSNNVLEVVTDSGTLGTVGDNQLHFVSTFDGTTTHLQVRYDTNSAYGSGQTTASNIIALDFAGDVTANLVPANLTFI